MIPDSGSQQQVPLWSESICKIPFQARTSDVKLPELRQHSSNRGMHCFINVFGTFPGTWDQPDKNLGVLYRCAVDILSNITNCEIKWPGMLVAQEIDQVGLVGCTYDWHNRRPGRKLILCIPPPITCNHLAVVLTTLRVSKAHQLKIEVHLKWKMC